MENWANAEWGKWGKWDNAIEISVSVDHNQFC
jgi:hypothetical protein